jgi:hypothetical protein
MEALEEYLEAWSDAFGNQQKMQRLKNVAQDWQNIGGDRSDEMLQQLDDLAREIGNNLAAGDGQSVARLLIWVFDNICTRQTRMTYINLVTMLENTMTGFEIRYHGWEADLTEAERYTACSVYSLGF